jgi:hypothetical protein
MTCKSLLDTSAVIQDVARFRDGLRYRPAGLMQPASSQAVLHLLQLRGHLKVLSNAIRSAVLSLDRAIAKWTPTLDRKRPAV